MVKKLCITLLISALMLNLASFAKGNKSMTRENIADKNLEILFNITTKNNNGSDKDFMDILQKYIFFRCSYLHIFNICFIFYFCII